jgi:tungstate transport system ATP-binding protein
VSGQPRQSFALELARVRVSYANTCVLRIEQLGLARGEILTVVGPNGAGKSVLLRILGLLERPSAGEVLLDGVKVDYGRRWLRARRRVTCLFQEPLLCDGTVQRNVELGLRLRHLARAERVRRAGGWMERLGIGQLSRRRVHTLSGGEAQRTALARALAIEPEVLLLDEPFAALDAPTRAALVRDLAALLRGRGQTAVIVTHDLDEAVRIGDRLAVLLAGRLRQLGPPALVLATPADEEVRSFVAARHN